MPAQPSIWKKEIKLRRGPAAAAPPSSMPRASAPHSGAAATAQVVVEPRFRRIEVLSRLLEQYADEFPDRAEERRKMLARLAESAVDGVLPAELDGVIHTLFYDLLRRGLKPSKQFWKRENRVPRQRKPTAKKVQPARATSGDTPFWKKEVSLRRPPKPAKAVVVAVAAEKTPFWKRELSIGRAPKAEKPAKPEKPVVEREQRTPFWKKDLSLKRSAPVVEAQPAAPAEPAAAEAESTPWWKRDIGGGSKPKRERKPKEQKPVEDQGEEAKSGLKRELRLPKPSLPRLSVPTLPTFGRKDSTAKLVGLRIGSSQLAAALVHNNGSSQVLKLARSSLDRGVVAGGEVRDPDALAAALKQFFAKHRLPRRGIRLGIATNRIGVRVLEVPVLEDPKQHANAIRFRAQEVLPIPIAEAVLDHVVIGQEGEGEEAQQRVLLVFAHRELVDGYMDACNRAGLRLHGIDFDAFALLRALASDDADEERRAALVAVSIGHERTIFAVSDGKVCDFARVLEWGGAAVDAAIGRALEVDPPKAEEIKQLLTLSGDGEIEGLASVQVAAARAAVERELQLLARELVSSLQFYQSRDGSLDIGEVLLTGGGAQLDGIDAELSRQLGVPVRIGDPLQRVRLGKDVAHPASPSLTIAVGLGIEEAGN